MTKESSLWKKPYPITTDVNNRWKFSFGAGVFVFGFLYIFRPFGITSIEGSLLIYTLAFGAITFLITALFHVGCRSWWLAQHNDTEWTVGNEIILLGLMICCIGLVNYPLAQMPWIYGWSWSGLAMTIGWTLAVGFFPMGLSVLIHERRKSLQYIKEATAISDNFQAPAGKEKGKLRFTSTNGTDEIHLTTNSLRYIQAADNYIIIYHMDEDEVTKSLLRNTMKYATEACNDFDQIQRIHKSYIANLQHVTTVQGNAQGYRLTIADITEELPVSRSLNKMIKAQFS